MTNPFCKNSISCYTKPTPGVSVNLKCIHVVNILICANLHDDTEQVHI